MLVSVKKTQLHQLQTNTILQQKIQNTSL